MSDNISTTGRPEYLHTGNDRSGSGQPADVLATASTRPTNTSFVQPFFVPAALRTPFFWIALVALILLGWQWFESRASLAEMKQEISQRLASGDSTNKVSQLLAHQSQEQVASMQVKLAALEGKFAESQSQQQALEALYQDLARSRDDWVMAEIEQSVTLAAQQLQLVGNVKGALSVLQTVDARIAGSTHPQFIGVRHALVRDMDRLKALPQIDISVVNVRLESVVTEIDTLSLGSDIRPRNASSKRDETTPESGSAWRHFVQDIWGEIRGLVRIQRFDRQEAALLAPDQVFFLRENIKLRLLNARLALLSHDQTGFRTELKAADSLIARYFDGEQKSVQAALASLRQLEAVAWGGELPTLIDSLSAIHSFQVVRDKAAHK